MFLLLHSTSIDVSPSTFYLHGFTYNFWLESLELLSKLVFFACAEVAVFSTCWQITKFSAIGESLTKNAQSALEFKKTSGEELYIPSKLRERCRK